MVRTARKNGWEYAEAITRENWQVVGALACALQKERWLSEEEVQSICEGRNLAERESKEG